MRIPYMIPEGLTGPGGLIAAVLAIAARDVLQGDIRTAADALDFFGSPLYLHYLTAIGLDPDLLPEVEDGIYNDTEGG